VLSAQNALAESLQAKVGASDVVQETFLKAHEDIPNFRGRSQAELRAWLHRILINAIANERQHYRAEKRQISREISLNSFTETEPDFVLPQLPAAGDSPSRHASIQEETERLQMALQRVPERYRLVIRLRHQENYSFVQIGRLTDRTAEAARKL